MAESVRSPFDYREPPTLDSDGDGSKPPPPRGRVCGRKRKGTPVKVCDRAYVTEDEEEESMSEHSYSPGDGQYPEGAEDRLPPPGSPYYLPDPTQLCVPELGEEGASGVRGPVLFHPPPNCRIREVHCGTQVRLVVIAIRDIAKGEEITVDYSLTDWGENAMLLHISNEPKNNIRRTNQNDFLNQEEEAGPHPLSLSVSDYLTPSWSLSPSSSPLTHSEASDSDREEDEEEIRGRMLRRRKKRKLPAAVNSKKKSAPPSARGPGRPCSSFSRPGPVAPPARPLAPPTTNINNNININIGSSSGAAANRRQHCPYCGRHYRSLARHLEKYHGNQPDVRTAMELAHSSASNPAPPSLFSREKESPATRSSTGSVSFSLSLSPPSSAQPTAAKKGPSLPLPAAKLSSPPLVSRVKSPSPPPTPAAKRGRRMKKEKHEEQQKVEVEKNQEELLPPPTPEPNVDPDEDLELSGVEENAPEKNGEIVRCVFLSSTHRQHMSPLLSSLSCLIIYLRRQQHSSSLSLTRSPHSAEAWRLLCHSSLSLLILYNRHRECEVAKLTIQDYRNRVTPQSAPSASSAMESFLSPFERQVLSHLPRAGVLGKRGRVQPLILPPHCESCLDLLLRTSPNVGVDPESPYVFSRPYHSPATPLRGTDLLRNLARASGAKNAGALTATRVRRQVAILTQLLLLEEGEGPGGAIKRLEDFLEREYHVTQNCSSIIRDPALMSRVGRVVLYGEREGVLFRGMSLQDICLELDVMSGNSGDSFSEDSDADEEKEDVKEKTEVIVKKKGPGRPPRKKPAPLPPTTVTPPVANAQKRRPGPVKSGKRGVLKRPWSEAERVAVETHLKKNLLDLRVPAKADCERCLELCPLLVSNQRDWRAIKFYVHNRIQLLKKQGRRESAAAVS
uniref:Si:cabz01080528.1 n=1 Tax=Poecilia formosa TaxID=48698 RepID=A0A087XMQ7_POEFO